MSDLLTPAELAAIGTAALQKSNEWRESPEDSFHGWEENTTQLEDAIETLLRHIAALEARMPAPATDVDALLADAEEAARKTTYGPWWSVGRKMIIALRESRAREVAEPYRHALEQRLICSNLPLLTGDADADLMRFVFHEQEIALSPEAGVIAELKEQRDTALSWTATYTNMDVYRRCLAAAIARAEKAEAERGSLPALEWPEVTALKREEARAGEAAALNRVEPLLVELAGQARVEWLTQTSQGVWAPSSPLDPEDANVCAIRRVLKGGAQ